MAEAVLLTVQAAAERLSLGRTSVYALIQSGELRVVRIGRSVRFLVRDVDALAERFAEGERVVRSKGAGVRRSLLSR